MSPRDTRTGAVLEQMVLPALTRGGYRYQRSVEIGERLGGGRHIIDVLAHDKTGRAYLISLKWQQVSGTAEQKVAFEVMCLVDAVLRGQRKYKRAYLVLGGRGWSLRDFFTRDGLELDGRFRYRDCVTIVSLEDFVARANTGQL